MALTPREQREALILSWRKKADSLWQDHRHNNQAEITTLHQCADELEKLL